ncbi:glutamate carboxypeptidase [Pseudomonas sp. D1-3]
MSSSGHMILSFAAILFFSTFAPVWAQDHILYQWAEKQYPRYVEDLKSAVEIESGSRDIQGLMEMQAWLASKLRKLGATVTTYKSTASDAELIVSTFPGEGHKRIMLLIHYDTVYERGTLTSMPFRVEGNKAYGPGVADAKGGLLLILYVVEALKSLKIEHGPITLVFNPDEELGSPGTKNIFKKIASDNDFVFIYEPPDENFVTVGTRGVGKLLLESKGRTAHAGANPEDGINAISLLVERLAELQSLGDSDKDTSVNWTVINGGDAFNRIPGQASATADVRVYQLDEFDRVLVDAKSIAEIKNSDQSSSTLSLEKVVPPLPRNSDTECLYGVAKRVAEDLDTHLSSKVMRYGTDAGFLYEPEQAPAIIDGMGPIGGGLHSNEEWLDLSSFAPRLYLSVKMIEKLSSPTDAPCANPK